MFSCSAAGRMRAKGTRLIRTPLRWVAAGMGQTVSAVHRYQRLQATGEEQTVRRGERLDL